jgi:2,3-diaminopropionate biosynthesis protein SbnB
MALPAFDVVPGPVVADILAASRPDVIRVVREVYLMHEKGETINPASNFLRFPDRPDDRVIALPAYVGGTVDRIGIKWIASVPSNMTEGLPRASAVLILNDYLTGFPIACLEGAGISAARTAASATLAALALVDLSRQHQVAFVGTGVIASTILDFLHTADFPYDRVICFDHDSRRAARMASWTAVPCDVAPTLGDALRADVVVLATTAGSPYVGPDVELAAGQLLLNISLRDLAPELLLRANNVLDDVDHCLTAATSPHLAEQLSGSRTFVNGTIGGVLRGEVLLDADRPTVFSPFGLGALDIAVGELVLAEARRRGSILTSPDFFGTDGMAR